MLQLALLGGRGELSPKYFLCSGEQCLDFCLKLGSAVRTGFSFFPSKLQKTETCSIPTSANWTSLCYNLDSEQNNKQKLEYIVFHVLFDSS